jgi:hypothetical protein
MTTIHFTMLDGHSRITLINNYITKFTAHAAEVLLFKTLANQICLNRLDE